MIDDKKLQQFLGRMLIDLGAAISVPLVRIGVRLGLYKAMDGSGPMTSAEFADKANISERYAREWLAQNAASGYLSYDPSSRRFEPHRGLQDTLSPRGLRLWRHAPCSTRLPGSNAACWRPPRSGWHRPQTLRRRPALLQCTFPRHARRHDGKYHCHGTAHCGRARTQSDQGPCPQLKVHRTSDRPGSLAHPGTTLAPSGWRTHSQ